MKTLALIAPQSFSTASSRARPKSQDRLDPLPQVWGPPSPSLTPYTAPHPHLTTGKSSWA